MGVKIVKNPLVNLLLHWGVSNISFGCGTHCIGRKSEIIIIGIIEERWLH